MGKMTFFLAFMVCICMVYLLLFGTNKKSLPGAIVLKLKTWFLTRDHVKRGELFLSEFQNLKIRSMLKLQKNDNNQEAIILTPFLFYTHLVEDILRTEKTLGVGLSEMLLEIKNSVMSDIKFLRMKQEIFRSTHFQMFAMSGLIWLFVSSCERYLELNFHVLLYVAIFIWQLIGFLLFKLISSMREESFFSAYSPWFLLLYRSRLFLKSHLETAQFFQYITIELENIKKFEKSDSFEFERQSFYNVINHCRDQGIRGDRELVDLTQHLQDKRLFRLDKFQRELSFLKFFILCFFFLLTYLAFVIYLFSFFMD